MPKIKKDELNKVINSLYKPKERILPANQKKTKQVDSTNSIHTIKQVIYFIDGYNLMHSIDSISKIAQNDLISARNKIIDIVSDFQGYSGAKCILVFDAYKNEVSIPMVDETTNITIVYTKINQTADMYIEQETQLLNENNKIYVVTSDALEQLRILSNNSFRISCREFINKYNNYTTKLEKTNKNSKHHPMKELRKLLFED